MSFDFTKLITNRTERDVENAINILNLASLGLATKDEIKSLYDGSLKGSYDFTDLNRVSECMGYIDEELRKLGYSSGYSPVVVHKDLIGVNLPKGYIRLEYVESVGNQYINTGVIPTNLTRFVLDSQITQKVQIGDYASYFGCRGDGKFFELTKASTSTMNLTFLWSSLYTLRFLPDFSVRRTVEINKNSATVDKNTLSYPESTFSVPYPIFIGAENDSGTAKVATRMRIYRAESYEDGVPTRLYTPCKTDLGEVGLYDFVNDKFYGNSGSGKLLAGPECDTYTWYRYDAPTISQLDQFALNVSKIQKTLAVIPKVPDAPKSVGSLTIKQANDIEKILYEVNKMIENMKRTINLGWCLGIADIHLYGGV